MSTTITVLNFKSALMDAHIAKASGTLKVIEPPTGSHFAVTVEFDAKIIKTIEKDPLLQQQMQVAAKKVYDELIDAIADNVKKADKEGIKLEDTNQLKKLPQLKIALDHDNDRAEAKAASEAQADVQKVWESLKSKHEEYKQYKIKAAVSVAAGAGGLAVSLALVGGSVATGGASAAFGVIGTIKSGLALAEQITSLALSAEMALKVLRVEIQTLHANLAASMAKKYAVQANEYAAAVVKTFVGISQPTVKKCREHLETVEQKINGIDLDSHELAKDLNKILADIPSFKKAFLASARTRLEKHPSSKAMAQLAGITSRLEAYVTPTEKEVAKLIDNIHALQARVKTTSGHVDELGVKLNFMEGKIDTKGPAYLEMALKAIDVPLALIGDGNAMVKGVGDFAKNLAPSVADFAIDRVSAKVFDGSFLEV